MVWDILKVGLPFGGVTSAHQRARKPFQASAEALGLAGEGLFARGVYRDRFVELGVISRLCVRGAEFARHPFTVARVPFEPPFDLNLSVSTENLRSVGQAGDARRAQVLVQRLLLRAPPAGTALRADDESVSIEHYGVVVGKVFLHGMLSAACDAHEVAEAVRARIPSRSDEVLQLLQRAGAEHGLVAHAVPLGLSGRLEGHEVRLFHSGMGEDVAEVRLDTSFGHLLRLVPAARAEAFAFLVGPEPVEIGDAPFDGAFLLQSSDPARLREVLAPALREDLMRASLRGGVRVDGRVLELRRPSERSALALVELGREAIRLGAALRDALALHPGKRGAYR